MQEKVLLKLPIILAGIKLLFPEKSKQTQICGTDFTGPSWPAEKLSNGISANTSHLATASNGKCPF